VNGFHHTLKNGCPKPKNLTKWSKVVDSSHDDASTHVYGAARRGERPEIGSFLTVAY
jgi:hypothetical protein